MYRSFLLSATLLLSTLPSSLVGMEPSTPLQSDRELPMPPLTKGSPEDSKVRLGTACQPGHGSERELGEAAESEDQCYHETIALYAALSFYASAEAELFYAYASRNPISISMAQAVFAAAHAYLYRAETEYLNCVLGDDLGGQGRKDKVT